MFITSIIASANRFISFIGTTTLLDLSTISRGPVQLVVITGIPDANASTIGMQNVSNELDTHNTSLLQRILMVLFVAMGINKLLLL